MNWNTRASEYEITTQDVGMAFPSSRLFVCLDLHGPSIDL
jgi:hypothetical protein